MVKLSIRIFESVCTYHIYQYGQTFTVIKIENTISSPRMLMRTKVSMHVETVCLLSFKVPVYDDKCELERYNVFHASMLVRHSNDGKLYLYDVIDIKKETSNSIGE